VPPRAGRLSPPAFARLFEGTRYFREFFRADIVPRDVLHELGKTTCLCMIPGRDDHQVLLDVFFGEPLEDAVWEDRRRTRVESLSLFLDFHRQRPPDVPPDRLNFRVALAQAASACAGHPPALLAESWSTSRGPSQPFIAGRAPGASRPG
jgi:hypothetical protein